MVHFTGVAPRFLRPHERSLSELENEIAFIEKVGVWLEADADGQTYRPYRIRTPSPGSMKGRELKAQIEGMYPGVEVTVLSENLPLAQLRLKHAP